MEEKLKGDAYMKITTGYIEDRLKEYKEKSSTIETTLARIDVYKKAIDNPDSFTDIYSGSTIEIGMPGGKGGKPISPVERTLENTEENREEIIETLREWIKEDSSRIYPLQIEREQVEGALNALTEQQRYIVERKYFENMIWKDIEKNLNDKFRQRNFITDSGIKKINSKSVEIITKILEPYYSRFIVS